MRRPICPSFALSPSPTTLRSLLFPSHDRPLLFLCPTPSLANKPLSLSGLCGGQGTRGWSLPSQESPGCSETDTVSAAFKFVEPSGMPCLVLFTTCLSSSSSLLLLLHLLALWPASWSLCFTGRPGSRFFSKTPTFSRSTWFHPSTTSLLMSRVASRLTSKAKKPPRRTFCGDRFLP